MIKVICTNNEGLKGEIYPLTIGKVYDAKLTEMFYVSVEDDNGRTSTYRECLFFKDYKEETHMKNQELEINLESPIFEGMVEEANDTIQEVIEQLLKGGFEKGHVLISFDLSLLVNENNPDLKAPKLDYKVNSSCKKEVKKKGSNTSTSTIKDVDGVYVEVPVENPQQSLI